MSSQLVPVENKEDPNSKYVILREIGQGQFAKVFLALDTTTNVRYAIKVIPVDGQEEEREKQLREYRREVESLSRASYSNVVEIHEIFQYDKVIGLVIPHCAGTLEDVLRVNNGYLCEVPVACIAKQLLRGLVALHENSVVHRDIKASNILIDFRGSCKIADFNLSTVLEETFQQARTVCGTPYYLAPELALQRAYDSKADIWSFGVLLYYLLVGSMPLALVGKNISEILSILTNSSCHEIFLLPGKENRDSIPSNLPYRNPYALEHGRNWSPEVQHFLSLCFKFDPLERSSALDLFRHRWLERFIPTISQPNGAQKQAPTVMDEDRGSRVICRNLIRSMPNHADKNAVGFPSYVKPFFTSPVHVFPRNENFMHARVDRSKPINFNVVFNQKELMFSKTDVPNNAFLVAAIENNLLSMTSEEFRIKNEGFRNDYARIMSFHPDPVQRTQYLHSLWSNALGAIALLTLFEKKEVLPHVYAQQNNVQTVSSSQHQVDVSQSQQNGMSQSSNSAMTKTSDGHQ